MEIARVCGRAKDKSLQKLERRGNTTIHEEEYIFRRKRFQSV